MGDALRNKAVRGLLWSGIDRLSAQGISFLLGLVVARQLIPQDYGVIGMLYFFLAISNIFIDSGISAALIRKVDWTETDNATAFYFNVAVSVVAYLILFFAAPSIASFYEFPLLSSVLRIIAVSLFFSALCSVPQTILTSRIDFKKQAIVSVPTALVSGIVGIVLAYRGDGVWALVAQQLTTSIVRTVLLWMVVGWMPARSFSRATFRELYSFGSKLLVSGLLDAFYRNIYLLVIGKVFSAGKLGAYSRAEQFTRFPAISMTDILQRVTYPVLSVIQNEDERLSMAYRKIIRLSGYVVFPLMIWLAVVARPLLLMLLTEKWSDAVVLLQIMCFSAMWYPIHAVNLNLLQVKGRSDLFLKLDIIKKAFGVIVLFITIPVGLVAMCMGQVLTSLFALVVNTHYTGKLIHVGFGQQMRDLLPILFQSLLMGGVTLMTCQWFTSDLAQLIAASVTGAASYLLLSRVFAKEELQEVKGIISNLIAVKSYNS